MSELRSYPKALALGHAFIQDIFDGPVVVQEKVDGSQISFGVRNGRLHIRSKNKEIDQDDPGMFEAGILHLQSVQDLMPEGWTYRGEYLRQPKHNVLVYDRVPNGHIALYDVDYGDQDYEHGENMLTWLASQLGLEAVPRFGVPHFTTEDGDFPVFDTTHREHLLTLTSFLGGKEPIEGIVIKNYGKLGRDGKIMVGKLVRESFKEKHSREWKVTNKKDIIQQLVDNVNQEARWEKVVQARRDASELLYAPQDIGNLIKDLHKDFLDEEKSEIADALLKWAIPQIQKGITRGFPEFYKKGLSEGRWL